MQVICFYDYTCSYSYKALVWLDHLGEAGLDLDIGWHTFSLKEANRDPGTPTPFADLEISSISVLALTLAHAARAADFSRYHAAVFQAMHDERGRVDRTALLDLAAAAGVNIAEFERHRLRWLRAVADEHAEAVRRWAVFGTPTLLLDGDAPVFLKLSQAPAASEAVELWQSLCTIARCHPELVEIKRPPTRPGAT